MADWQARERAGECDLWYFDARGFVWNRVFRMPGTPSGTPLELPQSSHKQRLNVVGFLQRDTTLVPYLLDRSVETAAVVACMDQFSAPLNKKPMC